MTPVARPGDDPRMGPHTISLDHPKRGALTPELAQLLEEELDRAAGRPLLLTGSAQAFSAGLDLAHVEGLEGPDMLAYLERVKSHPVVAARLAAEAAMLAGR